MKKKCVNYLEPFNAINSQQYGFRSGTSTIEAVGKVVFERGDVAVLLCNFSKAFIHLLLLDEMECLGIRGITLHLFKSYLFNRYQAIYLDKEYSVCKLFKYFIILRQ